MESLKEQVERFLRENLFEPPLLVFERFREEFGQDAMMFRDMPDKPEGNKATKYLIVNGTDVVAVVGAVRAELTGR